MSLAARTFIESKGAVPFTEFLARSKFDKMAASVAWELHDESVERARRNSTRNG